MIPSVSSLPRYFLAVAIGIFLPVTSTLAQGLDTTQNILLREPGISAPVTGLPVINSERRIGNLNYQGLYGDETLKLNFVGVQVSPTEGLSLTADAWRLEVDEEQAASAVLSNGARQANLPHFYLNPEPGKTFSLDQRFQNSNLEANGVDLGVSFNWNTDKLGQFTLSTKASYIYDFNQTGNLPDTMALIGTEPGRPANSDLQGSLTLTWQLGNHSATAATNYFDSFKDIGELDIEEITELVDNITTFDLQYGYSVKTGKRDQAVISFDIGIRDVFDESTTQILNRNSRIVDQNGRVAYGTIKYQF